MDKTSSPPRTSPLADIQTLTCDKFYEANNKSLIDREAKRKRSEEIEQQEASR